MRSGMIRPPATRSRLVTPISTVSQPISASARKSASRLANSPLSEPTLKPVPMMLPMRALLWIGSVGIETCAVVNRKDVQRSGAERQVHRRAGRNLAGTAVERDDAAAAGIGVDEPSGTKLFDIIDDGRDRARRFRVG